MSPRLPARGRFRLVHQRPFPTQDRTASSWAEYARQRRAGLVCPPSVSSRTAEDVERSRLAAAGPEGMR